MFDSYQNMTGGKRTGSGRKKGFAAKSAEEARRLFAERVALEIGPLLADKKSLLQDKQIEEFSMDTALDYCFRFVRDSAKTWVGLADRPEQRARFQNMIFPEKVDFDGKKFGTKKIALVYKLNQENGSNKSKLVTPTGIEPVFAP